MLVTVGGRRRWKLLIGFLWESPAECSKVGQPYAYIKPVRAHPTARTGELYPLLNETRLLGCKLPSKQTFQEHASLMLCQDLKKMPVGIQLFKGRSYVGTSNWHDRVVA